MKQHFTSFLKLLSIAVVALFSSTVAVGQTNPTPQSMPYTQNFSAYNGSTTSYLAGWQGWTIAGSTSSVSFPTAAPNGNQVQDASGTNALTTGGIYDFTGKIGFVNTANALKSFCLSISTAGYTSVQVSYVAATQRTQSTERVGAIGLQYRIGTTGTFQDVGTAYQNINTVANITGTGSINPSTISVNLPAACDNLAEVQLRWVFKDVSGSGNRPSFSVDDVSVSGTVYAPPVLTYTTSPAPFSMFSTTQGTPSATQSIFVSGSNLQGAVTISAPAGFEVSTGGAYGSTATLTPVSGSLSSALVTIRITSTAPLGFVQGAVTISSLNATTQTIPSAEVLGIVNASSLTPQTISFTQSSPVNYGATPITLTGTATSGLAVTYSSSNTAVATVSGNTLTIVGAGSVTITANQAGNATYAAATPVDQFLIVNPITLTVTNTAVNDKYYDGGVGATITGTLVGVINSDAVTFVGVGNFSNANAANGISVTSNSLLIGAQSGNYLLTQPTGLTGNILPAIQTIAFTVAPMVTGDPTQALTCTSNFAPLNPTYSSSNAAVATVAGNVLTVVGPGSTDITVTNPGDANHAAGSTTVTLLVRTGIAKWNFESLGTLSTSGTVYNGAAATVGVNASGSSMKGNHASAASSWINAVGNGSATSLSGNGWAIGDYYQFQTSTLGFSTVYVSVDQTGSNTGPRDFQFSYSLDGTNYTNVGSVYAISNATAWSSTVYKPEHTRTFDLSSISGVAGQSVVYFRLTNTSTVSLVNGIVGTGGTSRVENFSVSGTLCPAEICNDGIDNNCNGQIDEGCPTINLTGSTADFCPSYSGSLTFTSTNFTQAYNVVAYLTSANSTSYSPANIVGTANGITGTSGSITVTLPAGTTGASNYAIILVGIESVTNYYAADINLNTNVNAVCADYGCMDNTACNYDALANISDGSCTYATAWYLNADGDGYAASSTLACTNPGAGYSATVLPTTDCNDNNAAVNPGATENLCNGIDDNCAAGIDEGAVSGCFDPNANNYNAAVTCPNNATCTYNNFTAGNIVVTRFGTGAAALGSTGTAFFLEEYNNAGLVGTITVPTTGTNKLVVAGSSTSEGFLSRSSDFSKLSFPGYDAALGLASVATAANVARSVGTVGLGYNSFNKITSTLTSGGNIRGTVGDGNNYWGANSSGGISYLGTGTSASVSNTVSNTRVVGINNGNLYFSTASTTAPAVPGIFKVSTGLPVTTGQTASLVISAGATSSPYGFQFNTAETVCYVADSRTAAGGGIQKWVKTAGVWSLAYTIGVGTATGAYGIAVDFYAGVNPRIYATVSSASSTQVLYFDDNGTSTPTLNTISTLLNATNKAFRAVAFAPCTPSTWYADADGDGYGNVSTTLSYCTQPYGYVSNSTDCNDALAAVNPAATEICNSIDDDCDTQIDEGVQNSYYVDTDGDGYGAGTATLACTAPTGFVTTNTDCNNNNAAINPAAIEICNSIDDNCSGATDEGLTFVNYYADADADGYGAGTATSACSQPIGYVTNNTDCNNNNAAVHPGATEICNSIDDNCSGAADEGIALNNYYIDADGDGYGSGTATSACSQPSGYVANNTDCSSNNAAIHPGAAEICNGIDDNCSGSADEGIALNTYYNDADGDGYGAGLATTTCSVLSAPYVSNNSDCDDSNIAVNTAATESCSNTIDDNCNGTVNENCGSENGAGESPATAVSVWTTFYPTCSAQTHTLAGFNSSTFSQSICLTGEDKWHSFVATSEAVSIVVGSTANDILVELQSNAGALLATENAVAGLGGEVLNFSGLTAGQVYKVGVRNYNSALGIGSYTICVKMLKRGGCDTGSSVTWSSTLNLCKVFKASWAGAGVQYRYTFVGTSGIALGNTYVRTQSSDYLTLSSVTPTMPMGCTYNASVTTIYSLTDAAGGVELIEVPALAPCPITMEQEAATALRTTDRCSAGPRFRGAIVASLPWVCGVTNWKWEFTELDAGGNAVGIPIVYFRGAASNYCNLALVVALQYGKTYAVRTAPVFSYGTGAYGPVQTMCIIGSAGMVLEQGSEVNGNATRDLLVTNEVNMSVYPNPTHGTDVNINLSGITSENVQIRVVDAMGRQVWSNRYAVNGLLNTNITFERPLANGLYFVEAIFNGEVQTQRLMVQK